MAATIIPFPYGPRAFPLDRREALVGFKVSLAALANMVDERSRDEGLREFLDIMARLWRYSPFNQWLIGAQRPGVRMVAGRKVWARRGRTVRGNAKPIAILAPSRRAGGGLRTYWVWVFDIRDTDGPALSELDTMPVGESDQLATLERAAASLGIEVLREALSQGCAGRSLGGRVVLRQGMSSLSECRVLAHELAHETLHQAERARRAALRRPGAARTRAEEETEADATAYVVLQALGLPSGSVDYIAWQGGSGADIMRSWKRLARAARAILLARGDLGAGVPSRARPVHREKGRRVG